MVHLDYGSPFSPLLGDASVAAHTFAAMPIGQQDAHVTRCSYFPLTLPLIVLLLKIRHPQSVCFINRSLLLTISLGNQSVFYLQVHSQTDNGIGPAVRAKDSVGNLHYSVHLHVRNLRVPWARSLVNHVQCERFCQLLGDGRPLLWAPLSLFEECGPESNSRIGKDSFASSLTAAAAAVAAGDVAAGSCACALCGIRRVRYDSFQDDAPVA